MSRLIPFGAPSPSPRTRRYGITSLCSICFFPYPPFYLITLPPPIVPLRHVCSLVWPMCQALLRHDRLGWQWQLLFHGLPFFFFFVCGGYGFPLPLFCVSHYGVCFFALVTVPWRASWVQRGCFLVNFFSYLHVVKCLITLSIRELASEFQILKGSRSLITQRFRSSGNFF